MPHRILKKRPLLAAVGAGLLVVGTAMAAIGSKGSPEMVEALKIQEGLELMQDHLQEQTGQIKGYQYPLYRDTFTHNSDTEKTLLDKLNVYDDEVMLFLRQDPLARSILNSPRSVGVTAEVDANNALLNLKAYLPSRERRHFQLIAIERGENNLLKATSRTIPAKVRERVASGTIKNSLLGTAQAIRLPVNISYQLADIFETRLDFTRDIHSGDSFQIIYEEYEADGTVIGTGKILAAQFINRGKKLNAIWFEPNDKDFRPSYLTFDGKSLRTTFLAYPLEYTRISSQFGRRLHPIHKVWKNHNGTDYAAPTGTPIRTVGDGRVIFAGTKGGYGKTVIVQHDKSRTTLYAHMSRINVSSGQILEQGDVIGAVGATGWATGPHLHLEFHEAGVRKDPAILAKQTENIEITKELKPIFEHTVAINAELINHISKIANMGAD